MSREETRRNDGAALMMAIVFVVITSLVVGVLASRLGADSLHVDYFSDGELCLQGAEFALAQSRHELAGGGDGSIGLEGWQLPADCGGPPARCLPTMDAAGVTPVTDSALPGVRWYTLAVNWANDTRDNNGDGTVDGPDEAGTHSIYAVAQCRRNLCRIEVILHDARGTAGTIAGSPDELVQLSWREL
ncbi:MAG: hypothetical protein HY706_07240 [Candidatus Hydrogenedentes bacterium]|nr:hypothetical protein [Candidatus Hydrogenedentota bacterium]